MTENPNVSSMLVEAIKASIPIVWPIMKKQLIALWPLLLGFVVFIIVGMLLQIMMIRLDYRGKLSADFNRLVGSLFYALFFIIILAINYWIFGAQVIDEVWLGVFGLLAFPATGFFLRAIGFWYY